MIKLSRQKDSACLRLCFSCVLSLPLVLFLLRQPRGLMPRSQEVNAIPATAFFDHRLVMFIFSTVSADRMTAALFALQAGHVLMTLMTQFSAELCEWSKALISPCSKQVSLFSFAPVYAVPVVDIRPIGRQNPQSALMNAADNMQ